MTDKWSERLSEYLDGELNETEGRSLESHLATCAECAATLEELRGVTARAGSLDDRPPAHDLWAGIAQPGFTDQLERTQTGLFGQRTEQVADRNCQLCFFLTGNRC